MGTGPGPRRHLGAAAPLPRLTGATPTPFGVPGCRLSKQGTRLCGGLGGVIGRERRCCGALLSLGLCGAEHRTRLFPHLSWGWLWGHCIHTKLGNSELTDLLHTKSIHDEQKQSRTARNRQLLVQRCRNQSCLTGWLRCAPSLPHPCQSTDRTAGTHSGQVPAPSPAQPPKAQTDPKMLPLCAPAQPQRHCHPALPSIDRCEFAWAAIHEGCCHFQGTEG